MQPGPRPQAPLPARRRDRLRSAGNLVNLATPVGLALARAGGARLRRGPNRLWLAEGYRWRFPLAGAFTVGDVVLTRHRFAHGTPGARDAEPGPIGRRTFDDRLLAHEGRHAWQWLVLGPAFLPAYVLAQGWSWVRTGDLASANPFERLAGLGDGGYERRGTRRRPGRAAR